jgi:hypothetical protein
VGRGGGRDRVVSKNREMKFIADGSWQMSTHWKAINKLQGSRKYLGDEFDRTPMYNIN